MKKLLTVTAVFAGLILVGCMKPSYHLRARNLTGALVEQAKVTFGDGRSFEWGVLDSRIEKGAWPVLGPLGGSAIVEWNGPQRERHAQSVILPRAGDWNAIRFLLKPDGVVEVETERR